MRGPGRATAPPRTGGGKLGRPVHCGGGLKGLRVSTCNQDDAVDDPHMAGQIHQLLTGYYGFRLFLIISRGLFAIRAEGIV